MKTSGVLLISGILLSMTLSAQNPLKNRPYRQWQNDSLYTMQFQKQLKNRHPFGGKRPGLKLPEKQILPNNQSLAMVPDSGNILLYEPYTNMPVVAPRFHSKMPVVKPDANVHYFLKIKKY